jgi:hypothetical protein
MDSDNPKTKAQQMQEAFAELRAARSTPAVTRGIGSFANSLDLMSFTIGRYLVNDLKVPTHLPPALIPLIDQRWSGSA